MKSSQHCLYNMTSRSMTDSDLCNCCCHSNYLTGCKLVFYKQIADTLLIDLQDTGCHHVYIVHQTPNTRSRKVAPEIAAIGLNLTTDSGAVFRANARLLMSWLLQAAGMKNWHQNLASNLWCWLLEQVSWARDCTLTSKKHMHTAWASLMKSTISCCKAAWTFGAPFSSHRHTEWTDL